MNRAAAVRQFVLVSAASVIAGATGFASTGVVFNDANGNGILDAGEQGLASVQVSNGLDVVSTDGNGAYSIADRPGARIFVIKPRGWKPPVDADRLPLFHAHPGPGADFPLQPSSEPAGLKVLVLADPQPSSAVQIGYLSRGLVDRLGKRPDISFGVTLGDIVYDRPDLFAAVNAVLARVGVPWYSIPGNHDLELGTPDEPAAVASFERAYGSSSYAFHAGPALFLALDDVRPLGGPRYVGGLRSDQFEFIANVLRGSPKAERVVLLLHIPLFSPDPSGTEGFRAPDRLRLFNILKGRRVLILSGHTHYQRHVMHGTADGWDGPEPIHEYNVAAACGGFWGGPLDRDGIPLATMWDGTPPGFAVVGLTENAVSLDYFPARLPADHQMSLHAPEAVAPRQGYVSFYVNVFNGDDRWTVEARLDERMWNPVRRVLGWDPSYAADFLAQDTDAHPPSRPRLPDPAICYHLWRGTLPADLPVGRHVLRVRATDPNGGVYSEEKPLVVAQP